MHLSSEQISRRILGERDAGAEEHLRECAQCAAEVARLETTLGQFRGAVRDWSGRQTNEPAQRIWSAEPARRGFGVGFARWALIGAALALAAYIPIHRDREERRRQAERARQDAVLLEQVDAQVSRVVAAPLEPLARLVAWHPDDTRDRGGNR